MLPHRLGTALLRRSTIAGAPAVRSLPPRRLLATPPAAGSDEQVDEPLSIPRVAGIPITNNYETGVSGYNHPDPEMTGGYVNPPAEKRQFRDPYGEYWNKQDRRNYGETVNEDEDILGRFSPEAYTWTTPGKGLMQNGLFVLTVLGLCGVVYSTYPDKPAVPRTFPYDGLREALGGEKAPAAKPDTE
ncbi:hypothetical protein L211DRAFT_870387 [Terfezia boudieri ATCC MYA-4762]|uniref:NADH:ubiquinone oxidoreductase 20.1kD subunit n=1 Tax=Terfezia boudieri ATCC MYA-4762 TaxID=1051890 RepID=A0A3N4LD62_9PEZI|nr:hypothetical protein L211DRAFT_870387 [Terfezia boudieri ATCC MYA-4762]